MPWYVHTVFIRDRVICEIEFSPGADYLIRLATRDNDLLVANKIRASRNALTQSNLLDTLDQLGSLANSTMIWRKPSSRTIRRHAGDSEPRSLGEMVLQRALMFAVKFGPFKKAWESFENPSEMEEAIDYALSLDNAPYLHKGGSPTRIQPASAIKVLEHQVKELEWLEKHRPSHYRLYYEWEDQTRHLIGKIFGFKSQSYQDFFAQTDLLRFSFSGNGTRIARFLRREHDKKAYVKTLIFTLSGITAK